MGNRDTAWMQEILLGPDLLKSQLQFSAEALGERLFSLLLVEREEVAVCVLPGLLELELGLGCAIGVPDAPQSPT